MKGEKKTNDQRTKDKQTKKEEPFFARYLESQDLSRVGGARDVTMKYPSDDDESTI